jgi:hypothetical protein
MATANKESNRLNRRLAQLGQTSANTPSRIHPMIANVQQPTTELLRRRLGVSDAHEIVQYNLPITICSVRTFPTDIARYRYSDQSRDDHVTLWMPDIVIDLRLV